MTGGELLEYGIGGGALSVGLGLLAKLGSGAFALMRESLRPPIANPGNGVGEWRGRMEMLLEQQQVLSREQMQEGAEVRRIVERNTEVLGQVAKLLHGVDTAIARSAVTAKQMDEVHAIVTGGRG